MGPYYDTRLSDELGSERLTGLASDPRGDDRDGLVWYSVILFTIIAVIGLAAPETPATSPDEIAALSSEHAGLE